MFHTKKIKEKSQLRKGLLLPRNLLLQDRPPLVDDLPTLRCALAELIDALPQPDEHNLRLEIRQVPLRALLLDALERVPREAKGGYKKAVSFKTFGEGDREKNDSPAPRLQKKSRAPA